MLLLNVPYAEKDEAKALGAKWNPNIKLWIAPGNTYKEYKKFQKWFDGNYIIQNEFYLIEASRICWKCGKPTKVICFAIKDYIDLESEYCERSYLITSMLSVMSTELLKYLESHYNFKEKYSQAVKDKYWANCCSHCDSLQGINFLFNEPFDSPFYVNNVEKARQLTVYKIKIPYDLCIYQGATFPIVINTPADNSFTPDELINKYSIHTTLDI